MPDQRPHASAAEDRLDELFAEYLQAKESGELMDTQKFVTRYPELAEVVAAHEGLGRLVAPLRGLATTVDYRPDHIETLPVGTVIGDYEVLEEIGRGGMGTVYKARNRKFNMLAALKMISSGSRASEDQRTRFLAEVEHHGKLNHPNIVAVTGGGEYEGHLYFTMKLIERTDATASLAKHLGPFRDDPAAAATLMVKVARAVHHAHQRGVLHRDLKPSNVLLDDDGNPHVTDFGLAKQIEMEEKPTETSQPLSPANFADQRIVGTVPYMSPEQADPDHDKEVTTLSDVYGLGATLYTLLTGRRPFQAPTPEETLNLVRDLDKKPERPRQLNPRLDRTVEGICLKCLDKYPDRRYRSAEGLAKDLDRWLRHERTEVPQPFRVRSWNWCRRNPGLASLSTATVVLLILAAVMATLAAHYMEDTLRKAALLSNGRAAERVADEFHWLLREQSRHVLKAARVEDVRTLLIKTAGFTTPDDVQQFLGSDEGLALHQELERRFEQYNADLQRDGIPPFATMFFLNKHGRLVDHVAPAGGDATVNGDRFDQRDYFVRAKANAPAAAKAQANNGRGELDAVHVSRVFKSNYDQLFKFAISVPVLDDNGTFLGAIEASIPMHDTLGLARGSLHSDDQQVVLVGRVDQNPPTDGGDDLRRLGELEREYHILLHKAFEGLDKLRQQRFPFAPTGPWPESNPSLPELRPWRGIPPAGDDQYRDPLWKTEPETYRELQGRWLAAFCPVGNTELMVIVQQRYEDAVDRPTSRARTFVLWGWGALALTLILVSMVIWCRRSMQKESRKGE